MAAVPIDASDAEPPVTDLPATPDPETAGPNSIFVDGEEFRPIPEFEKHMVSVSGVVRGQDGRVLEHKNNPPEVDLSGCGYYYDVYGKLFSVEHAVELAWPRNIFDPLTIPSPETDSPPDTIFVDGEEFRPIRGYDKYTVSKSGVVRGKSGKIPTVRGFPPTVSIAGYAGPFNVRHAVALAWLPPASRTRYITVNLNGDATDNRADNIAWMTPTEHRAWRKKPSGRLTKAARG